MVFELIIYLQNYIFPNPSNHYVFCCHYIHNYYSHVIFFGFFIMLIIIIGCFCYKSSFKFDLVRNDSRIIELFLQFLVVSFLVIMAGPGF